MTLAFQAPVFTIHFIPSNSSWINQVERLFAESTGILLQRSIRRSLQTLEKNLRNWVNGWNESPKRFIWAKAAEEILESLGRLMKRINGGEAGRS